MLSTQVHYQPLEHSHKQKS